MISQLQLPAHAPATRRSALPSPYEAIARLHTRTLARTRTHARALVPKRLSRAARSEVYQVGKIAGPGAAARRGRGGRRGAPAAHAASRGAAAAAGHGVRKRNGGPAAARAPHWVVLLRGGRSARRRLGGHRRSVKQAVQRAVVLAGARGSRAAGSAPPGAGAVRCWCVIAAEDVVKVSVRAPGIAPAPGSGGGGGGGRCSGARDSGGRALARARPPAGARHRRRRRGRGRGRGDCRGGTPLRAGADALARRGRREEGL